MAIPNIALDWSCDCTDQKTNFVNNLADIQALKTPMINLLQPKIEVHLPYFPGQGLWESEWIKMGNSLPLPDGIKLLWYDTTNNRFGGEYTAINGDVSLVYPYLPSGTLYGFESVSAITNPGVGLDTGWSAPGGNPIGQVEFNCEVLVPSYLHWYLPIYLSLGTAIRIVYFLNNVNQYHVQFGTAGDTDCYLRLANLNNTEVFAWRHYLQLAAGSYNFDIRIIGEAPALSCKYNVWPAQMITAFGGNTMPGWVGYSYLEVA